MRAPWVASETSRWHTVIVGRGAAGLSAALVLGRARRRVLLVDAGGHEGRTSELVSRARGAYATLSPA